MFPLATIKVNTKFQLTNMNLYWYMPADLALSVNFSLWVSGYVNLGGEVQRLDTLVLELLAALGVH